MRINIIRNALDGEYLTEEAEKFESREAMRPYLIMSSRTLNSLSKDYKKEIIDLLDGTFEFKNYRILLNGNLDYGEVDIR